MGHGWGERRKHCLAKLHEECVRIPKGKQTWFFGEADRMVIAFEVVVLGQEQVEMERDLYMRKPGSSGETLECNLEIEQGRSRGDRD